MRPPEQRHLVSLLAGFGLGAPRIARLSGIPRGTVGRWLASPARAPISACPRCDGRALEEAAYSYLLGVYLGDGHIVSVPKGVFRLSIFLDLRYPGIIRETEEAIVTVKKPPVGRRDKDGCAELWSYWKHWPCLFPQHGPGLKHRRPIVLAPWQEEIVQRHPEPLLRGLIHSDGCRGENRVSGRSYPRYLFTNRSTDILRIFASACDRIDVRWTQSKSDTVSVARAGDTARLDRFIGPKR